MFLGGIDSSVGFDHTLSTAVDVVFLTHGVDLGHWS